MLCPCCTADPTPPAPARDTAAAGGVNRLRGITCERCGAVLAVESSPNLLDKLVQLAQFGLTAGVGPLLESSRKAD